MITDEKEFIAKYPKLHETVVKEARRDGVDLSKLSFVSMELQDEEYASVEYDGFFLEAQGSEDGSFGEWSTESCGEPDDADDKKDTVIPAGYRLSVTSWENDGDHYRTIVKDGLSKEMLQYYVGFIKFFYSGHSETDTPTFGNMYQPSEAELENAASTIGEYLKRSRSTLEEMGYVEEDEELDNDAMSDIISDLHYELLGGGDFHFRVLDNFRVEHVPVPITIQNVTEQFN